MPEERILVVDDEPEVVRLCTRILAGQGYAVQGTTHGLEAVALLEAERFDLLVVDIKMPDVDGLTVLRRGRELNPSLTAVAITGFASLDSAIEALHAGARGFVLKPFGVHEFSRAVDEALAQRQKEEERLRLRAQLPILEIAQALTVEENVNFMAGRLLEAVVRDVSADQAALLLLDDREDALYVAGSIGLPVELVDTLRISLRQGRDGQVLLAEEVLVLEGESARRLPLPAPAEQVDVATAIWVPLRTMNRFVGTLHLSRLDDRAPFTSSELNLLSIVGQQIATAIENARLYEIVAQGKREWEVTFDAIVDGISIHDSGFRIVRTNRALAERLGMTPQELVGHRCYEVVHGTTSPPDYCPALEAVGRGLPSRGEREVPRLGGIFQCSVYPIGEADAIRGFVHVLRDVTESKRAAEKVREERDRAQEYLDIAGVIILVIDVDRRVTLINRKGCEILGYQEEEILGRNWFRNFLPERDRAQVETVFAKLMAAEIEPVEYFENPVLTRDGEERIIAWHNTVVTDRSGQIIGTLSSGEDITERKRAEKALRESEDRFRRLYEQAPLGYQSLDEKGNLVEVNQAWLDLLGYSYEEVIGRWFGDFLAPGNEDLFRERFPCFKAAGETRGVEFEMVRKDGTPVLVSIDGRVGHDERGDFKQTHCMIHNITERRQAEDEIRRRNEELIALNEIATTIGQSLDLGFILHATLDKVLEVMQIDGGWVQLVDERDGLSLSLAAHRGVPPEMIAQIGAIRLGEGVTGQVAQSGHPIVVAPVSGHPQLDTARHRQEELSFFAAVPIQSQDRVLGVLGVFGRRQHELGSQELQLLATIGHQLGVAVERVKLARQASEIELLRELDRLRSELIANVSHEVRTPLGLIKIFCTTLLREDVDFDQETQREFLHDIAEETERLERIVDHLLDLSRMEDRRLPLDKSPIDVGQLAREVLASMEVQLTQHRFAYDFPADPLVVTADLKRIEQVLRNLLGNAIKYSPEGGIITLTGYREEQQILISVRDQGIGIPAEALDRIFERFYRVESEVSQRVGGAGLGLAVCRGIVEAHGGYIWAESTPGEGSTFTFTLPVGPEPPAQGDEA